MSVLDRFRLDGDVALVTGAAGGIGGAFAEAMAEAGADVALVDVDEAGLSETTEDLRAGTDADVLPLQCDVSDEASVDAAVEETVETLGGLDVAFANAGVATSVGSVVHADMDEWHDLLSVNLTGVFHTDRAAAASMRERGTGGRIVNTASILGLNGASIPGLAAYAASKGGVVQVTKQLAAELGRHDIRVNALAPGWIQTGMTGGMLPGAGEDEAADAVREQLTERMAIERLGDPEDLKGTALYLASEASPYTTGEVVLVDGGMNAFH
ncbi:SDR family NAD(P)-dependent oxidoreductase [Halomarina salina]|uniref:SDR family NAD(P)-dependent oxidoreductase n=1 Tax=Halomarina salina TaxID=1872699 RepID=A0ABD5RSE1_9EURY|nr:SDR family oxidoreductase [Halomarina salina]